MTVDDVWKEQEFEKRSRVWEICRQFLLFVVMALSKLILGFLNKPVMYNEARLHRAITERQTGQALITYSNHNSFLDAFIVPNFLKWRYCLNNYFCLPWTPGSKFICHTNCIHSLFFTLLKCPPIVIGDGVYQRTMNFIKEQLNRGNWLHLFPEGVINQTEQTLVRFKWGIGRLISECKTYPIILPIYQVGMNEVLPMKKPYIPRIGKQVTLIVGEPIDVNRTVEEMKRKNASQSSLVTICWEGAILLAVRLNEFDSRKVHGIMNTSGLLQKLMFLFFKNTEKTKIQEEIRKYITDVLQEKMELLAEKAKSLHHSRSVTGNKTPNGHCS